MDDIKNIEVSKDSGIGKEQERQEVSVSEGIGAGD